MPRPAAAKDDDAWGKIAADLFGIDLDTQADFDFNEPEAAPPPVAAAAPAAEQHIVLAEASHHDIEEDDDDAKREAAPQPAAPESDDYWNALETWEWNEDGTKPTSRRGELSAEMTDENRSEFTEQQRPPRRGDRRERGGGGRGRSDRGDRGDRSTRSRRPADEPARSESAPRREPSRETASEERRTDERRPKEPRPERPARPPVAKKESAPPPRSRPAPPRRPPSDDFGDGLLDELEEPAGFQEESFFDEPEEVVTASAIPRDDFENDRFEDADSGDDDDEESEATAGESDDAEGQPRRRRRRRRRRRGGRSSEAVAGAEGSELAHDVGDADLDAEESAVSGDEPADERDDDNADDVPRRRRRRRRRRPASAEAPSARVADDEEDEADADDDTTIEEFDRHEAAREPVARVSYDDVPTWEEAISYLVRIRGSEPRSSRDSGRRPARRPPPAS